LNRPTHYIIKARDLKSSVVNGVLDGSHWTEIDEHKDNQHSTKWNASSFAVSKMVEFRFIRMIGRNGGLYGQDALHLTAVDFFGTLSE
jgi:hypothetical protein